MPRESFERALQAELDQVLLLGSMSAMAIQQSVEALQRHDHATAKKIIEADLRINEKRYHIEQECITLIATQQPMARDVRFLTAILEIITELERIGDYAKGISKINLLLQDEIEDPPIYYDLHRMADLGLGMLHRALDAFVSLDVAVARAIPVEDDQVDRLYNHVYMQLIQAMMTDKTTISRASHLMWAAHNLERMADRVTNICERIVYAGTGEMKELDVTTGSGTENGDE
jgi:phosphate transport system protein